MSYQVHALDPAQFAPFWEMTDEELAEHGAVKQIVNSKPGTPCRISLQDAEVGEEVILLGYAHLKMNSPYDGCGAIFIRKADQVFLQPNTVPEVVTEKRLFSVRGYDERGMMIETNVVLGPELDQELHRCFANQEVALVHVHNAKPGCFAFAVTRIKFQAGDPS